MKTPKDVIFERAEHLGNKNAEQIFELYDESSEFRRNFDTAEDYREHFDMMLTGHSKPVIEVFKESVCCDVADVLYLSKFEVDGEPQEYYCKTIFKMINGEWRISRETLEKKHTMPTTDK